MLEAKLMKLNEMNKMKHHLQNMIRQKTKKNKFLIQKIKLQAREAAAKKAK